MNFILRYTVADSQIKNKFESENHFQIVGSQEAIFDLFFHLQELEKLHQSGKYSSVCPRFVEVFDLYGNKQDMTKGIKNMSSINTYK